MQPAPAFCVSAPFAFSLQSKLHCALLCQGQKKPAQTNSTAHRCEPAQSVSPENFSQSLRYHRRGSLWNTRESLNISAADNRIARARLPYEPPSFLVPGGGLEPPRPDKGLRILSPLCLPISPSGPSRFSQPTCSMLTHSQGTSFIKEPSRSFLRNPHRHPILVLG